MEKPPSTRHFLPAIAIHQKGLHGIISVNSSKNISAGKILCKTFRPEEQLRQKNGTPDLFPGSSKGPLSMSDSMLHRECRFPIASISLVTHQQAR